MNEFKGINEKDDFSDAEIVHMSVDQCESALVALMSELEALKGNELKLKVDSDIAVPCEATSEEKCPTEAEKKDPDSEKAQSAGEFEFTVSGTYGQQETLADLYSEEGTANVEYLCDDDLFCAAARLTVEEGVVSLSFMQRRLGIGYGKATAIVDRMEKLAIVGPSERNLPRRILVSPEKLERILAAL